MLDSDWLLGRDSIAINFDGEGEAEAYSCGACEDDLVGGNEEDSWASVDAADVRGIDSG